MKESFHLSAVFVMLRLQINNLKKHIKSAHEGLKPFKWTDSLMNSCYVFHQIPSKSSFIFSLIPFPSWTDFMRFLKSICEYLVTYVIMKDLIIMDWFPHKQMLYTSSNCLFANLTSQTLHLNGLIPSWTVAIVIF